MQAFAHTAAYDAAIHRYLARESGSPTAGQPFPAELDLRLEKVTDLRYGENPHQQAAFYRLPGTGGLPEARLLHGKALSYNNLLDLQAACSAAASFSAPTVAIIKHNNPCGLATAGSLVEAYRAALDSDPASAYGGVIACNLPVDGDTAGAISSLFVEAIIAPRFAPEALAVLQKKRDVRLLELPSARASSDRWLAGIDMRRVSGGLLLQEMDRFEDEAGWQVASARQPTAEERAALAFAWRVAAHVKSNAIVLVKGTATVGVGAGQMSRVDSTEIAIKKAGPERARGAVLASDAFFPFADSIELAAQAGVTAVIQPGGSIHDADVLAAVNRHNLAMIVTGSRHFRH